MNIVSKLLAASVLAFSFAAPALAQTPETQQLDERNVYLFMNGKMVHMKANDATHAMIMKHFKPLTNGTMIYFSGGKFYMAQGRKMATEIYGAGVLPGNTATY
jgi:hypothetical protein